MTKPVFVEVGPKYAEALGYQEVVGSMGLICEAMSALTEVHILSGPGSGEKFDIHNEDVMVVPAEEDIYRYFILDHDNMAIFFTKSREQFEFVLEAYSQESSFRAYGMSRMEDTTSFFDRFTFHDIDAPHDEMTRLFHDTFHSMGEA